MVTRFAEVAVPVPLRRTFTYRVDEELREHVHVGSQIDVPFGRKTSPGFVIGVTDRTTVAEDKLKSVGKVTYPEPVFDEDILRLAEWVSEYYVASLGQVLMTALPGGLRKRAARAVPARVEETLGITEPPANLTKAQSSALFAIRRAIDETAFRPFLLHGVTGSGKTEVYVRSAMHAARAGRQTLVLVPEIALAQQVVERFRLAFGDRVGVLHSKRTSRDRQDTWRAARAKELDVVVGARSAVFTPLPALGLIVVDEENDGAYKQSDAPRYHAREVSIVRAQQRGVPVVLGSATPSLESYANAHRSKFHLLKLPRRIDDRPMSTVRCIDLRRDDSEAGEDAGILTAPLIDMIGERLARREQVIVFLNRRGYAPFVQCRDCGEVTKCDQCDVSLTYHRKRDAMICHYCGAERRQVRACPECGSLRMYFGGVGTQKVEDELAAIFPHARVLRFDFDTTRRVGSSARILGAFARGKADILLGTQMVAKGLDFHNVTLVGVVNADAGLNFPDFRSSERTFQLLTQVAGRAGRGERPGEVVLQTHHPEHDAITLAAAQDFESFFEKEMAVRKELFYPPFSRMANLLFDGENEERVADAADAVAGVLATLAPTVELKGPAPQPLSRLRGKYRWHLALVDKRHEPVRKAAEAALLAWSVELGRRFRGVRVSVDVDPVDLL